jgi:hypothetical protein
LDSAANPRLWHAHLQAMRGDRFQRSVCTLEWCWDSRLGFTYSAAMHVANDKLLRRQFVSFQPKLRRNTEGIFRLGTRRDHTRFRMWQLFMLGQSTKIQAAIKGRYIGQSTLVMDMEGLTMSGLYMPLLSLFNETNKLVRCSFLG